MRWLRQAIACFVVCFSVSCCGVFTPTASLPPSSRPTIEAFVYISDDFSEKERLGIIDGVRLWERGLNGHLVWHEVPGFDDNTHAPVHGGTWEDGTQQRVVVFRKISAETADVKSWDSEQKKNLVGMCIGDALIVAHAWIIHDRIHDAAMFRVVVSHEFGHALGLGHVDDMNSTMSEYLNAVDNSKLSTKDVKAFCKAYKLLECDLVSHK